MTQFESGWENPDNHPSIAERPRPMFDTDGRPTDHAPPPEPAPELDGLIRPGDVNASQSLILSDGATYEPLPDHLDRLDRIKIITDRLDQETYLQWGIPGGGVRQLILDLRKALGDRA